MIANDWKDDKINTYAPYAYDAVYSIAQGLDKMLKESSDMTAFSNSIKDGEALHTSIKNVDFAGITGQVSFTTAGDRAGDFGVMNSICGDDKWESKGYWNPNTGFSELDMSKIDWPNDYGTCRTGGSPPKDAPLPPCSSTNFIMSISGCDTSNKRKGLYHWKNPSTTNASEPTDCAGGLPLPQPFTVDCPYIVEDSAVGMALIVVTAIGMTLVLLVAIYLTLKMKDTELKRTQPIFLILACLGGVLGMGTVFTLVGEATDLKCNMVPALTSLGLELMYGALITKMIRVDMIFNNASLKVVKLPTKTMFLYLLRVVALPMLVLILHLAVDEPGVIHKMVSHGSRVVPEKSCKSAGSDSIFFFVLLVTHVALIIYGALLAFKVRKVQDDFQESKTILMGMYNTLVVAAVVLPLVALLDLGLEVRFILVALGCAVGFAGTCLMVTIPKLIKKDGKISPMAQTSPADTEMNNALMQTLSMRQETAQKTTTKS